MTQFKFLLITMCFLMFGLGPAQAAYYLYQLPDGSRLVTDRKFDNKRYKLVTRSRHLDKLGKFAAKKTDNFQAPVVNYMRFEPLSYPL